MIDIDKSLNVGIRKMTHKDIDDILKIEQDSFPDPWPTQAFLECLVHDDCYALCCQMTDGIVGYAIGRGIFEEFHIYNVALHQSHRRKGYGSYLMSTLMSIYASEHFSYFLEVRKSNESAIAFYESFHFKVIDVRKSYYRNPVEDALVMKLSIASPVHYDVN